MVGMVGDKMSLIDEDKTVIVCPHCGKENDGSYTGKFALVCKWCGKLIKQ